MGITYVTAKLTNPNQIDKSTKIKFLVDSGSTHSVVPSEKLYEIGIKPITETTFDLMDGTEIKRKIGIAIVEFKGKKLHSQVVFGEKGDATLFGLITLEGLGLVINTITRELKPFKFRL